MAYECEAAAPAIAVYLVCLYRMASSGISQFIARDGRVIAAAPFPGQGERLIGSLALGGPGKLPIDRYVALPAVVVVAMLTAYLAVCRLRDFAGTRFGAKPSPGTNFATNA